jgi:hypothetical protein
LSTSGNSSTNDPDCPSLVVAQALVPGQGHWNFAETLRILDALGYEGFVSIECLQTPVVSGAARHLRPFSNQIDSVPERIGVSILSDRLLVPSAPPGAEISQRANGMAHPALMALHLPITSQGRRRQWKTPDTAWN